MKDFFYFWCRINKNRQSKVDIKSRIAQHKRICQEEKCTGSQHLNWIKEKDSEIVCAGQGCKVVKHGQLEDLHERDRIMLKWTDKS